jgi:hypothetical protein
VQAQVITYGNQSNPTELQVVISSLFFSGLFLDIIGGCTAFMEAVQLQRIYTLLLRRTTSVSAIINALEHHNLHDPNQKGTDQLPRLYVHIHFREVMFLHALCGLYPWQKTLSREQESRASVAAIISQLDPQLYMRIQIHLHEHGITTKELQKSRLHVRVSLIASAVLHIIVFMGVACLVVGGLCYVKDAHSPGVWITSFAVVGGILTLFVVIILHSSLMLGMFHS